MDKDTEGAHPAPTRRALRRCRRDAQIRPPRRIVRRFKRRGSK